MSSTSGASPTVEESVGGGEDAGVPRVYALVGAFGQRRVAARKMARLGQELANGNPTAHYWEGGKPGPEPEERHEKRPGDKVAGCGPGPIGRPSGRAERLRRARRQAATSTPRSTLPQGCMRGTCLPRSFPRRSRPD